LDKNWHEQMLLVVRAFRYDAAVRMSSAKKVAATAPVLPLKVPASNQSEGINA